MKSVINYLCFAVLQ